MTFENSRIVPPPGIRSELFTIRPITVADVELDYAAVMESREFLRTWEQSTWPEDDFTVADNLKDLQGLEQRHNDGISFGYTIMNPDESECLGCVYIFPTDARWFADGEVASVSGASWSDYEVITLFWIRKSRLAERLDRTVLDALLPWLERDWTFGPHLIVTNEQFEQQVAMLEGTDLELQFKVKLPKDPAKYLAYA
jgi:hypothetical protein